MPGRPTFEKPPLIEVVCGVQFDPLVSLQAPYLGFFWEKIRDNFPRCHSVPPLASGAIELPHNAPAQVTVQFGNMPELPRIWFINEADTELVQVQQDRLLFNWKKGNNDRAYPRYPVIIDRFKSLLKTFTDFVTQNDLGSINIVQQELTHLNHISPGIEIPRLRDIGKVLPDLSWRNEPPKRFLPEPSAINFRTQFPMPEGTMIVALATAKKPTDQQFFLRFDLTARGVAADGDHWKWFDSANTWIVDAFVDLTAQDVQKRVWERRE